MSECPRETMGLPRSVPCSKRHPLHSVPDGVAREDPLLTFNIGRSSTASLASSIVDYPVEFGRRYHKLRAGCKFVPQNLPLHLLVDDTLERLTFTYV